ncbi:MAG: hypothetical protein KBB21_02045 [Nannocystaceae bacterium]|nr:hypothetical protein [Deltaproteobacteria bacterium]MBP7285362.1 hypothetical protein [Nannocystaceae bacterium]
MVVGRRVRGGSWVAAAVLVHATPAEAATPSLPAAAEPAGASSVAVTIHGDEAQRAALQIQLEGALPRDVASSIAAGPVDLASAIAPAPVEADTLARVWIELAPADRGGVVTVALVDGRHERVLVRHIAAPIGVDAAVRETIATLVASAIEALRDGAVIGIERAVAQAQLDAAIPPPPADSPTSSTAPAPPMRAQPGPPPTASDRRGDARISLPIELGWSLLAWSREQPLQHGPRLALGVLSRDRWRAGAGLSGQYRLPARVAHDDVGLRLSSGSVRVWAGLHPGITPRVGLRARVGAGVDLVRASVSATTPGVRTRVAAVHALPVVRASFGVGVSLTPGLQLALDAALEVDLVDTRFVLEAPDRTVFDPWRARPGVTLSLAWDPLVRAK